MMTLFKSLFVLSRLAYGSPLWSPHLVKHIDQLEKIQISFTKHITGLHGLEYSEQLVSLKLFRFKEDVNAVVVVVCHNHVCLQVSQGFCCRDR